MKKIPTVLKRNPDDMARVLDEVTPGCEWVLAGEGTPTRQYDGTCVMLATDGTWWARREVKKGKSAPLEWVLVEYDENTGKAVGWEPIEESPFQVFLLEALRYHHVVREVLPPATYELIGPRINRNPEDVATHRLVKHADAERVGEFVINHKERDIETIKADVMLAGSLGYEGIVWHHPDGRMAKLKFRDLKEGK